MFGLNLLFEVLVSGADLSVPAPAVPPSEGAGVPPFTAVTVIF